MKITALMGCSKFGNTARAVKYFASCLEVSSGHEVEYVYISDYGIDLCVGCHNCIIIGETRCPHHTQYAPIEKKLMESDAVIMASPEYMAGVTGVMKNFLDHAAYNCHRPKYFGKKAYLLENCTRRHGRSVLYPMKAWLSGAGFEICGREYIRMPLYPLNERTMDKKRRKLQKAAESFSKSLSSGKSPGPRTGTFIGLYESRIMSGLAPGIMKADSLHFGSRRGEWIKNEKVPFYKKFIGRAAGALVRHEFRHTVDTRKLEAADGRTYNEFDDGGGNNR